MPPRNSAPVPLVFLQSPANDLPIHPAVAEQLQTYSKAAGGVASLLGATALLGWVFHSEILKSFLHGHVAMKTNAAICLMLSGVALVLVHRSTLIRRRFGRICSSVALAFGGLTSIEYIFSCNLGIDQLLFREAPTHVGTLPLNRMAPTTALAFVLLALAFLLLETKGANAARWMAGAVTVFSLLTLLGYSYSVSFLHGLGYYGQMAFPMAIGLTLLSTGLLCARTDAGFGRILAADTTGGMMLRRLLPLAIVAPWLLGWISDLGSKRGLYEASIDNVLFAAALMLVLTSVIFWNAGALTRLDIERQRAEGVLRRSRDQWELTFDCMSEGLSYHDVDYNIVGANDAFYNMLGRDTLAGCKCYDVVHHMSQPPDYCPMRRTLASKRSESSEFFEPRLQRYLSVRTDPVQDQDGRILRVVHVVNDITERKQAELAVQRLAAIVESSDDAIIGKDLYGHILTWNRGAEKMYGYTAAEVIGKSVNILCPTQADHDIAELLVQIKAGQQVESLERPRMRKDGSRIYVSLTISPILNAEGHIVGASTIARDISERKRAENVAQVRLKMLEAANIGSHSLDETLRMALDEIESLTGSVVSFYHFLEADQETLLLQNWSTNTLRNMCTAEGKGSHYPVSQAGVWVDCIHEQRPVIHNDYASLPHRKGLPLGHAPVVRELVVPILRSGRIVAIIGVGNKPTDYDATDVEIVSLLGDFSWEIVERKRAEVALQTLNTELEERVRLRTLELEVSNKELEAFSYSVSHDLRAPLRSIDGFSQILFDEYGNQFAGESRDFLQRMRAASQHMGQLIDSLLQLSRVSRSEMRRVPVDLSAMARDIAAELRKTAPERQAEFVIAGNLAAQADPKLLQIAVYNLLSNAWKFTSKRIQARIEFGTVEQNGKPAYFVRDNGAGFDMAYANKLFGAFQRLHGANEFEGSGIGLATVQRIIRRHGGRIWAEGIPDQGATFYFTLS